MRYNGYIANAEQTIPKDLFFQKKVYLMLCGNYIIYRICDNVNTLLKAVRNCTKKSKDLPMQKVYRCIKYPLTRAFLTLALLIGSQVEANPSLTNL
jgi:hypothetical protein